MKWVFLLCLLVLAGLGGVMGLLVGYRWITSMQADVKVVPGELTLVQPAGTLPRSGGELAVAREVYQTRPNPIPKSAESAGRGKKLFEIYCVPCHGIGGKGVDGPVTPRFIPPPDLTGAQIQGRTDGQISHAIGYGGATGGVIMPAYREALSVTERWDIVNYIRTLAQK